MANLRKNFESKTIGQTRQGELIQIELRRGYALCVNIGPASGGGMWLGVLKWHEGKSPIYFKSELRRDALSFGSDWVIDYDFGSESFPGNQKAAESALIIKDAGAFLTFRPAMEDTEDDELTANLTDGGTTASASGAFRFLNGVSGPTSPTEMIRVLCRWQNSANPKRPAPAHPRVGRFSLQHLGKAVKTYYAPRDDRTATSERAAWCLQSTESP